MINSTAIAFVVVPVLLAVISNLVFTMPRRTDRNPYLPPGWVIGTVWVILFGLLGYTAYLVKDNLYLLTFIGAIIVYCLAYPTITNLEPSTIKTRALNAGTFFLATILIAALLYTGNQVAFTVPLWLWAAYVNIVDIVAVAASKSDPDSQKR